MTCPTRVRLLFIPLALVSMIVPRGVAQSVPTSLSPPRNWTETDKNELLWKAAQGDHQAQFWLGAAYEQGLFGRIDSREAVNWLRKAASHGHPDAQVALGQMYESGAGVAQNYSQAAKWYRKAAGHVPNLGGAGQGRNNLGLLYLDGLGVQRDYVRAYMWFRLADSRMNLAYAKTHMTAVQVEHAERMAMKWKTHHSVL